MTGSNTITRRIDWQAYSEVFPERYVLPSKSDAFIQEKLQHIRRGRALDIGGGVTGTGFLLNWALQYRLLDPFVDSNLHSTNWELESPPRGIPRSYDVVLARGSLNYLSVPQIRLAANLTRGVFAFNTFKHPSNGERQYSSKTGSGIERYEFFNGAGPFGKIVHTLCPDNDTPIVHEFFYYPVNFLVNILQSEGLSCEIQEFGNTVVFFCTYDKPEKQEEEKEKELQTKSEVCKENTILEIMLEALCPDCGVSPGCKHLVNCEIEICSSCYGKRTQCLCEKHDPLTSRWTGEDPRFVECRTRGWWCQDGHGPHFRYGSFCPCGPNDPGAILDLNRFSYFAYSGVDVLYEGCDRTPMDYDTYHERKMNRGNKT
jgi:hypothetical protein